MKITCISDLHGHYPELEGGDLLIIAGDLTAHNDYLEYCLFQQWAENQSYDEIVIVPGNHDGLIQTTNIIDDVLYPFEVLVDSYMYYPDLNGLKIYGSPWIKRFEGMNPKCMAFTVDTEEELTEKWALIPDDTDILITHGPPYNLLDVVNDCSSGKKLSVGSQSLREKVFQVKPRVHIFGHIHENGSKFKTATYPLKIEQISHDIIRTEMAKKTFFINCSYVNERYQPVNKPITIEI